MYTSDYIYYPQLLRVKCGNTNIKFTEEDNEKVKQIVPKVEQKTM